jgi:hypothetical protein
MDTQLLRKIENSKFYNFVFNVIAEKSESEILKYFENNFTEIEFSKINEIEKIVLKLSECKYFEVLNYIFESKLNFREFNYLKSLYLKSAGKISQHISLLENEIEWSIQNNYYQYYLKNLKDYIESSPDRDRKEIYQIWKFSREGKAEELINVLKIMKDKNIEKYLQVFKNIISVLNCPNQTAEEIIVSGILNYKLKNINYEVLLAFILSINSPYEKLFQSSLKKKINSIVVKDEEILKMELEKFKNHNEHKEKHKKNAFYIPTNIETKSRFKDLKHNLLLNIAYNENEIKKVINDNATSRSELMDLVSWMLKNKKYTEILLVLNELPNDKKEHFKDIEWELVQRINEKN